MSPDLTITSERGDRMLIVRPIGEHDINTSADLREALVHAARTDEPTIVVDLTQTTFFDSTCLHALIDGAQTAKEKTEFVIVLPAESPLRRAFEILDLYDVLEVVEALGEVDGRPQDARRNRRGGRAGIGSGDVAAATFRGVCFAGLPPG